MSVAAVKVEDGKIFIGADSQLTLGDGSHKKEVENAKIWQGNDIITAGVGAIYEFSLFCIFCHENKPRNNNEGDIFLFYVDFVTWKKEKLQQENFKLDCSYLFVYKGKAFLIDEDFYIKEILTHQAIGVGMSYAEAGLFLNHSIEDSLKVACRLSPDCEEPVVVYSMEINKE